MWSTTSSASSSGKVMMSNPEYQVIHCVLLLLAGYKAHGNRVCACCGTHVLWIIMIWMNEMNSVFIKPNAPSNKGGSSERNHNHWHGGTREKCHFGWCSRLTWYFKKHFFFTTFLFVGSSFSFGVRKNTFFRNCKFYLERHTRKCLHIYTLARITHIPGWMTNQWNWW